MIFDQTKIKEKFNAVILMLEEKLKNAAVLSASPALVEDIQVKYQGYIMKLKELCAIRAQGPRTLIIEPWDKNIIKDLISAIFEANIGVTPLQEQDYIRLSLAPITGDDKERIVKKLKEIKEQSRINVRRLREEFLKEFEKAQKEKIISEDQKFKYKDALEKIVKEYNQKIDEITELKITSVLNA